MGRVENRPRSRPELHIDCLGSGKVRLLDQAFTGQKISQLTVFFHLGTQVIPTETNSHQYCELCFLPFHDPARFLVLIDDGC